MKPILVVIAILSLIVVSSEASANDSYCREAAEDRYKINFDALIKKSGNPAEQAARGLFIARVDLAKQAHYSQCMDIHGSGNSADFCRAAAQLDVSTVLQEDAKIFAAANTPSYIVEAHSKFTAVVTVVRTSLCR